MIPSYVQGSSGPALVGKTIGAVLDEVAEAHGDREGLVAVAQGIRLTYAELKREADFLAAGLLELGLVPGERIGIWSVNRAEWTVVQYRRGQGRIDPGHHQPGLSRRASWSMFSCWPAARRW